MLSAGVWGGAAAYAGDECEGVEVDVAHGARKLWGGDEVGGVVHLPYGRDRDDRVSGLRETRFHRWEVST